MKKIIIYFLAFLPSLALAQGNACTVSFAGDNNGSVFSGNQNVTINNEYVIPLDQLEQIVEDLKRLEKLKKEVAQAQNELEQKRLIDKAREERIKEKEAKLQEQENKINKKEKRVNQSKAELEKNKADFKQEIAKTKIEFKTYLQKIESSTAETPKEIKEAVAELKTRGNNIIKGANCLAEDYEVYEVEDAEGNVSYGFSLEALKNDPNYVFIDEYKEGLARVKKFNKYGFIDRNGKVVIDYIYDYAESFSDSLALVKNVGKVSFIDYQGNKVIKDLEEYEYIGSFQYGMAEITDKYKGVALLNKKGKVSSFYRSTIRNTNKYGVTKIEKYSGYGLVNEDLKVILEPNYKMISNFNSSGVAKIKKYSRYGLVNTNGKIILKPEYKSISNFNLYGIAKIEDSYSKYGLVNIRGKITLRPHWDYGISKFNDNGLAGIILNEKKWGIIGKKGKVILKFDGEYSEIQIFDRKNNLFKIKEDNWGIVNDKGEIVLEVDYYEISDFIGDFALIKKTYSYYGLINKKGKVILKSEFEKEDINISKKLYRNRKSNLYGFFDENGKVTEAKYSEIKEGFKNDVALVEGEKGEGAVNTKGQEFIPPIFYYIERNGNNTFSVSSEISTSKTPQPDGSTFISIKYQVFKVDKNGNCLGKNCKTYREILKKYYADKK